jgi:alpha-beta hydrolase superfamily lysophospholipase
MRVRGVIGLASMLALVACGADEPSGGNGDGDDEHEGTANGELSFDLGVPCTDKEASLYGDPGELPAEQGAIIRCVDDGVISRAEIAAQLSELQNDTRDIPDIGTINYYAGPAPKGGAHQYRVLYRTERGDGRPGYSVASIYVPDGTPTVRLPLLLLAHGARGEAAGCAPSVTPQGTYMEVDTTDGSNVGDDYYAMLWPLVASGFAVAATDSAGFANFGADDNPASGFADVQDMAKSYLDSGHALRKLVPHATSDDVLLIGLSQGGHTVLGSLEVSNDYPAPGKILAAAVYSPLWFAQRAWGISMTSAAATLGGIILNQSSGIPASIWYHYSKAEMYDGPGEGLKLFRPEVRDAVKDFFEHTCWSTRYQKLEDATRVNAIGPDFYVPELVDSVGKPALAKTCDNAPDKALCNKWMDRYRGDHPVLTGAAAKVPILMTYGLKDPVIPAPRFKCGVDKLRESDNPLEFCIDPEANHGGSVLTQSEYVNQWLFNKAIGSEVTAKCPSSEIPPDLECDPFITND